MGNSGMIRLRSKDQLLMVESVSSLLRAGLTLPEAFAGAAEIIDRTAVCGATRAIHTRLLGGGSLTVAVRAVIAVPDPFLLAMAKVTDQTGAAAALLTRAEEYLRLRMHLSETVRTASIYPAFVLALTVLGALMLGLVVIPELGRFLTDSGLLEPDQVTSLVDSGGRFIRILSVILGGLGAACVLVLASRRMNASTAPIAETIARLRLFIPVIGRLEKTRDLLAVAEASRGMVASGVSLDRAVELAADCTANLWVSSRLRVAVGRMRTGVAPAQAVRSALARHGFVARWLHQTEHGADLTESLDAMARFLGDLQKRLITRLGVVIEPTLVVVAGGFLLGTVFFLVRPLFHLYGLVMP
ncbi:MAG: type II secretion system F family protein [Spirochaetales bacterium]|nr:type II secretion system F family protein [Spirochaetales bacterium]